MQSVEMTYRALAALEGGGIVVHPQRCVLVRNRNAQCQRCARVCTSGAISIRDGGIGVDETKCIGCGTCATACPTCAIEVRDPGDKELFDAVRASMASCDGRTVIACDEACPDIHLAQGEESRIVRVKCLGRVDESLIVAVLVPPWADSIVLLHGACEECPHKAGREITEEVVSSARAILDAWGSGASVQVKEADYSTGLKPIPAIGKERDDGGALGFQLAKVGLDGTLPHHVPARRKRLVAAIAALGPAPDSDLDTRLCGRVSVDVERCVSCRMCATFCPAGAIAKWDEGDNFGLAHQPRLCVKCRCCESICPAKAIKVSETVPARALVDGETDFISLEKPAFLRGSGDATKGVFSSLLGVEEIFDR